MKKIKKLCIITKEYPTDLSPQYPFVDQLACQFADMGIDCTVLNPNSLSRKIIYKEKMKPKEWFKTTVNGNKVRIICPRYFSFSSKKRGKINTSNWTLFSFKRACLNWFKRNNSFDAVYGHFMFPSGFVANDITGLYKIPSFFAYGENTAYTIDGFGADKTRELLKNINGVISVSTENKNVLIQNGIFPGDMIGVFPNGINKAKFYPRNKAEMRKKYDLPEDSFIAAFVGWFINIKGPDRLSEAIEKVGSDKVKSVFIGSGEIKPHCGGILFQGSQPHDLVPELLSAADIFVLPTLAEGCCNAIIEAMACGLPVISSNLPFNDDILDDTCSIRVDPLNTDDIAAAIKLLLDNPDLRKRLSNGALEKAAALDIETRAGNILRFMEDCINQ